MLRQSDGTRKRTSPSSRSGLTTITLPRRRRSATSCVTRRGWLLAGFAPATRARSAAARSSSPTDAVPEILGRPLLTGGELTTGALAALLAGLLEPPGLVAVSCTRSVRETSAATGTYVCPVAPAIAPQPPPEPSQRCHW